MTTETITRGAVVPAGADDLLLKVTDLRTYFHVMDGLVKAVDGVSFSVRRGETLGIVGESGCGKSVTAMTIMRLLDIPPAEIASGTIEFEGRDVLRLPEEEMRQLRGNDMAMIFQEPMSSLNPVFTIGNQISEAVLQHLKVSKKEANERAIESLQTVGIAVPGTARQAVPARDVRRHAPARDDRHGAVLRTEAPDRGRADHRARCHDPGADPGAHRRHPGARPARRSC